MDDLPKIAALLIGLLFVPNLAGAASKISFWDQQRRGANTFNNVPLKERFEAARRFGIGFLRIAPNKWLNGRAKKDVGDFLLGPAEAYRGLVPKDLEELERVLDLAHEAGMPVVITLLSLPGNRWIQHNNGTQQRDIWNDFKFHRQSADMWRDLAAALKGHPAVVAYNIKNEPCPERTAVRFNDWRTGDYSAWYGRVKGTPQDLNLLYKTIVEAIRKVDDQTPIILDAGFYATPWAFKILEPVDDERTLYSFHMYEPYLLVGKESQQSFRYPGVIPVGETDQVSTNWNAKSLERFLSPVVDWMKRHHIPGSRVMVGEFGMFRQHTSVAAYLGDQIKIYNKHGWHWAFYSFREDDWHGMDYELGSGPAGEAYWTAVEARRMPDEKFYRRKNNPVAQLLRDRLK